MTFSARQPAIYEINTWVWLQRLSAKYGRRIELGTVPPSEWDALGTLECDAVWLMGVWERSPVGRAIALADEGVMSACRRALPDMTEDDVPGSPYSIRSYRVDERLGSLGAARKELAERGLRLILDFVPNHVAPDHRWTTDHPEYFIHGDAEMLASGAAFESAGSIIACGRDPNFPAWTDTAQLNAFSPALRKEVIDTLSGIASQCDGVRCDMAMLLLNDIFQRTWGSRAGTRPEIEFWNEIIPAVKRQYPQFLFLAEAYWDLEWTLQQLGFDFCYDKRLYDRLIGGDAQSLRAHLGADIAYQEKLVRFLENHDEPRAAVLPFPRHQAAAACIATLPGALLYHQGQFCGATVRLPVQLGRSPEERCNGNVAAFYDRFQQWTPLLKTREAVWQLRTVSGWPGNTTADSLLAWSWQGINGKFLFVVNFSDTRAEARIDVPWKAAGASWKLIDLNTGDNYDRDVRELAAQGLYVARDPWQYHLFKFES
jgi:hypothetical protein